MAELSKVNVNSTDYDLKDQKSRDALVDVVDNGAKNLCSIGCGSSSPANYPTYTDNGDGSVTLNGTRTGTDGIVINDLVTGKSGIYLTRYTIPAGTYVSKGTGNSNLAVQAMAHNGSNAHKTLSNSPLDNEFTYSDSDKTTYPYICFRVWIKGNSTISNYTIYPMICSKAAWDISKAYVPYGMTNAELTAEKTDMIDMYGRGIEIPENADLHTYTKPGVYFSFNSARTATLSNAPNISAGFRLVVTEETSVDGSRIRHDLYPLGVAYSNFYSENLGSTSTTYPDGWRPWVTYGPITTNPDSATLMDYMAPSAKKFYDDQQRQETEIGVVANAGAKNLLKVSVMDAKANAGNTGFIWSGNTASKNHVSFEIKDDLTVYVKSDTGYTASDVTIFYLTDGSCAYPNTILNGCPSGGSATTYELRTATPVKSDYGSGVTITSDSATNVVIIIRSGWSGELTFRPMIRSASISDTSYQPYARSNPALTAEMDYALNTGVKNIAPVNSGSGTSVNLFNQSCFVSAGQYILSYKASDFSGNYELAFYDAADTYIPGGLNGSITANKSVEFRLRADAYRMRFSILGTATITELMLRPAAITDPTFQPYARTNRDLTILTDEDRSALVEIVDGGPKNLLKNTLGSGTKSGLVYTTGTDGSIVITAGTATGGNADFVIPFTPTKTGQYVLQGCPDGGSGATYKGQIALYPSMANVVEIYENTNATATLTGGTQYAYRFRVYNGKAIGDVTIYPMVCSEATWKISHAYKPYSPSWQETYLSRGVQIQSGDLDDYKSMGRYYIAQASHAAAITHSPTTTAGYTLTVGQGYQAPDGTIQTATVLDTDNSLIVYKRMYRQRSSVWGWSSWYKFEGTAMN